MDKIKLLKKLTPYAVATLIFMALSFAYFPLIFQGKRLLQMDGTNFRGMSKEIVDYRESTGEEALWTNSMFGGMPAYLISTKYSGNIVHKLDQLLQAFPRPASFIFIYLVGFFVLMLAFRVNKWLSIVGAIAFGFSSYQFIILAAGHNSKAIAIAYMPMIIAGVIMAFRNQRVWGSVIFSIGLALNLLAGHPQITYYTLLILIIFAIVELVYAIRSKEVVNFLKNGFVLLIPALIAVGTDASRLMVTLEYGKYSIRGKSELTHNQSNQTSGLDRDYATAWSYGIDETFNLFIPNYKGGSNSVDVGTDSEVYKILKKNAPQQAKQFSKHAPLYWGPQPGTSGPVYIGAVIIFLFVFSLFIIRSREKWWIIAATLLSIGLAWGKYFMPLTDFFLDFVPGYNKFRTVSMILVIAELMLPIAAFLALQRVFNKEIDKAKTLKAIKFATIITGGFALLIALVPSISGSFTSPGDAQLPNWFIDALRADRISNLRSDAFRSLIFVLLSAGAVWALVNQKLKQNHFIIILGLLVLVDLWGVNKRYLNNDLFKSQNKVYKPFTRELADKEILKDTDLSYRVLNMNNPFNDPRTSYFHRSIGGYHAAKMRRYQELIELKLTQEIKMMQAKVAAIAKQNGSIADFDSAFINTHVLNMLNMRYVIYNPQAPALKSSHGLGAAWTVSQSKIVANADEEIKTLGTVNPATIAIIDQRYKSQLKSFTPDSTATINLASYDPKVLAYDFNAAKDQLVVFSEIYYPEGWKAYIDGKEATYFRANYVLRAMNVPAGKHKIEFKFEPQTYATGNLINLISSILLLLMIAGAIVWEVKYKKNESA